MIASLTGEVEVITGDGVVLAAGGIGYEVFVPAPMLDGIEANQKVKLFIAEHIREDSHDLYGFLEAEARQLFKLLLTVSGVGPKLALIIMSRLSQSQITAAIIASQADIFEAVSGVGKRTAAKIVIELKNKLSPGGELMPQTMADSSVYQALRQLGYSAQQAQTAMANLPAELKTDEERIKQALKNLGKR